MHLSASQIGEGKKKPQQEDARGMSAATALTRPPVQQRPSRRSEAGAQPCTPKEERLRSATGSKRRQRTTTFTLFFWFFSWHSRKFLAVVPDMSGTMTRLINARSFVLPKARRGPSPRLHRGNYQLGVTAARLSRPSPLKQGQIQFAITPLSNNISNCCQFHLRQ